MRNFLIASFVFLSACGHAPPFPQGEVGAMEQHTETVFVYKTPKSVEDDFEYLREDPLIDWNGGYCAKPEYFKTLHNYARDLGRYVETHCKCN